MIFFVCLSKTKILVTGAGSRSGNHANLMGLTTPPLLLMGLNVWFEMTKTLLTFLIIHPVYANGLLYHVFL